MAVEWYENMDDLNTPIIWDNGDEALKQFASITPDEARHAAASARHTEGHVISEQLENESFTFDSIRLRSASRTGSRSRTSPTGT